VAVSERWQTGCGPFAAKHLRLYGRGGERGTAADRRAQERIGGREQEDRKAGRAQQRRRPVAFGHRRIRRGGDRPPFQARVPHRAICAQLVPTEPARPPATGTGTTSRAHGPPAGKHPVQSPPVQPR